LKQNVSIEQCRTDRPFLTAAVRSAAAQCDVRLVYIIQFLQSGYTVCCDGEVLRYRMYMKWIARKLSWLAL